jgi:hypothetical protein
MFGYEFEIIYKNGKENMVVGVISRKEEKIDSLLCVISTLHIDWVDDAKIE